MLAALYLVLALGVPGAFLVANQASVVVSSQLIPLEEERSSSKEFAGNEGEDGGELPWQGPKRLRGVLLSSKLGTDKVVNLLDAPLVGPTTLLTHAERKKPVVADEVQLPQDDAIPQEILGRSPPPSR